jgi:hypothetical protein
MGLQPGWSCGAAQARRSAMAPRKGDRGPNENYSVRFPVDLIDRIREHRGLTGATNGSVLFDALDSLVESSAEDPYARLRQLVSATFDGADDQPSLFDRPRRRTSPGPTGQVVMRLSPTDRAVIEGEEMYDGYYAVATNLYDDVKTILDINHNRYKIEDCFRILKSYFDARPVHHRNRERIIAHFMICYTALLVYRLLEKKLDDYGTHFTIEDTIETLKNMNVINMQDIYYAAAFKGSNICTALNGVFGLGLDKKYYRPKELNKKIKNILN